jgi:hypothetical protein
VHNRGVGPNSARATAWRALAVISLGAAFAVAGPASVLAQGYPGPTSTTPPQRTEQRQNAGQVRTGESIVIESCGFAAASPATVAFNGQPVGSDVAGTDGCIDTSFAVRDDCPGVVIDGIPREGERGRNEIVVEGTGSNTAARTVITGVSISCSAGGGGGGKTKSKSSGTGDAGSVAARDLDDEGAVLAALTSPLTSDGGRVAVTAVAVLGLALVLAYRELRRRRRRALL